MALALRQYEWEDGPVVTEEYVNRIRDEIRKYPEDHGGDDEEAGYVQGLEDGIRILRGLEPLYPRCGNTSGRTDR